MGLTLTHLRRLADVPAGLCYLVSRHGLDRISGDHSRHVGLMPGSILHGAFGVTMGIYVMIRVMIRLGTDPQRFRRIRKLGQETVGPTAVHDCRIAPSWRAVLQ